VLLDRLIQRLPVRSNAIRTIIGTLAVIVLITVGVVVISQLLGFPAPPGVAAALAAVAAASYAFRHR
jgi:hypothetical protein